MEAPPVEYDPTGHGVAPPPPTTPWLVVDPVRQYHPAAQLPPAVAPIALVEPAPHQYPALQGPVHSDEFCPVLLPYRPAAHGPEHAAVDGQARVALPYVPSGQGLHITREDRCMCYWRPPCSSARARYSLAGCPTEPITSRSARSEKRPRPDHQFSTSGQAPTYRGPIGLDPTAGAGCETKRQAQRGSASISH